MKRVIKNQKKMKNAMYVVFGVFALALFTITRINPGYANDWLILDEALDVIVLNWEVEQLAEDEEVEEVQNVEGEEDITEPENAPEEKATEWDGNFQDLDDVNLEWNDEDNKEEKEDENQEDKENEEVSNEEENDENETINEEDKETAETTGEVEEPKDEDNNTNQENHWVSNENTNNEQEIILTQQNEESKFNKMIVEENNEIMAEKSATLLPWCEFNQKIKSLAKWENVGNWNCWWSDSLIKKFKRAINEPLAWTETWNISVDNTVYAWFDNSDWTIYYYTTADKIFMNENSSYMFNLLYNMEDIDLSDLDSKNVKYMYRMFAYLGKSNSEKLDLNLNKWDTNNVENMESLFEYSNIRSLSAEWWDFSNVSKWNYIFQNASITWLNASWWILPGQLLKKCTTKTPE